MKRYLYVAYVVSIYLFMILPLTQAAPSGPPAVYVWDFTTRDLRENGVTSKFTYDFELALVEKGQSSFRVLERRNLASLIAQIDHEKAIHDVLGISESTLKNLKAQEATLVIFGQVFDDVDSGEVQVTVTFQAFDGTKVLVKSASLSRGLVNDAKSRKAAMEGMVGELSTRAARVERERAYGFTFELKECSIFDRAVQCAFTITNSGEDRLLRICLESETYPYSLFGPNCGIREAKSSRVFDDFSTEARASKIRLANKETASGYTESMLIAGRPAEAAVYFTGVSTQATTIARLDLLCWGGGSGFTVTFRNIPLVKQ